MKHFTFPLLLATALVVGACSSDDNAGDNGFDPDAGKYVIQIGGAGDNVMSRAGFTGDETKLMIHYVSTRKAYDESNFPYNDGMKDASNAKSTLYMASSASAAKDATGDADSYSTVTQTTGTDGTKRYWDDAHGKNSLISLYAIAVPNKTSLTNTTNKVYFDGTSSNVWSTAVKEGTETTMSHELPWVVSATQTSATIDDEDITYSNNVSSSSTIGFTHNTKTFEKATETKSLVFNHALSRLTINVKKGAGFGDFTSEFNITTATLSKQTTGGTLNASTGAWTPSATEKDVDITGTSTVYKDGETQLGYTFNAQVLPNVTLKDVTETILTFVVDGNNYYIKGSEIFQALKENNTSLEESKISSLNAGYNYKLTVTIKKSAIEITSAKLVGWNDITGAEQTPSNAINLTASMEKTAGTQTTIASDIYRSTTLATGYTDNKNTLSDANVLGSAWYWPNNSTSYFFRTISPQNTAVTTATNDYISMTGGAIAGGNDYIWGAPLKEEHTEAPHSFTYSTTDGYNDYLYPAIGATTSEIHITQFHMMSNIEVQLTTSNDDSKIDLSSATVTMKGHKTSGTLNLSNALITPTGTASSGDDLTVKDSRSATAANFTWRTIPQDLTGVTFEITANGNNYTVKLTDILKSGSDTDYITSWLPGQSYTYQFKITKTGIVITSAKLVDWSEVTGTIKDITLEN